MSYQNHVENYYEEWSDVFSKKGWLDYLQNTYGDFKIAAAYQDQDGNPHWSKHRLYMDARNDPEFLARVNNRTIFPTELVIDIENKTDIQQIKEKLEKYGVEVISKAAIFETGSKGYHIHIFSSYLDPIINPNSKKIKKNILKELNADTAKANDYSMIALEFSPHWKTGKPKKFLSWA